MFYSDDHSRTTDERVKGIGNEAFLSTLTSWIVDYSETHFRVVAVSVAHRHTHGIQSYLWCKSANQCNGRAGGTAPHAKIDPTHARD